MQKFTLILLSLVLLAPLGIDLYLPTLPQIADGLNSPVSLIQLTIPLFLLVMGIGQLVTGPLVDNFGRKPIALIGLGLYIIGSIVAATATQWPVFFLARIIQGCGVCCSAVVAFSGVRDRLSGEDAARAYGFLNGALNIVPALAPLLGGILAEAYGWRAPFWFLCGYAVVIGLIVVIWLPETRPADTLRVKGLPLAQYGAIAREPRFLAFAFANAGALGMVLTYVSLAPHVLMTEGGLTPLQFSFAFGANGFWIMLVSAFVNKTIRKAGRPFCLAMGFATMLIGAILLMMGTALFPAAWQNHWALYMIPVAVSVAGLAFTVGPATSYALEPYQQQAGVAAALQGFIQMACGAGGSMAIVALPVAEKSSLALMMLTGAALALIAWRCSKNMRGSVTALK
ncbi:multidrug effflux MFS transporter [Pantoea sp. NPDC088449]|uniref:Bcr/CflA family efflux transporter n=1 Tax=Candidatus Pantoea floridensis TaxID=1938870 RepID=A0A286BYW9_9GAMM|nr:multidrug effflux MFS transporter [Pantoea floridensis]PIF21829.1 DHA1 family bicyclomycin/chloramphenicol resistance-like MFS transporter/DHA1 family florfenicol/chloramphenicol resistance protein-like MFS transporter [Enterobacteriaceae bacterium JKS000233]SOD39339.1 MFS transporter, DHA1 family, bicyclomycin/chloramphenicol resistance protein/MFS transporter, DHA1 family, florfenicol/chloramphenicol resistance protein [Pantoea floridensis]